MELHTKQGKIAVPIDHPILISPYFQLLDFGKDTELDYDFVSCLLNLDNTKACEKYAVQAYVIGLPERAKAIYRKLFENQKITNFDLARVLFTVDQVPEHIATLIYQDTTQDLAKIVKCGFFECFRDFKKHTKLKEYQVLSVVGSYIKICNVDYFLELYEMDSLFAHVCQGGNLEVIQHLVSLGADIHAEHDRAVISASCNGHLKVVQYLVSLGADIHAGKDEAFRRAAERGRLGMVQYLVGLGANIHSWHGEAVRMASGKGHLDVVKYLVSVGANIHVWYEGAVRTASGEGHLDVVQYLVALGANIHAENECAVRWASANGHLDMVQYLVALGANIHAVNECAVRWASEYGHLGVVQYLVSMGAKI